MRRFKISNKFLTEIAPIIFFMAIMLGSSVKMPMIIDEYMFYKLAVNFPDYSSTPDWFFVDRPSVLSQSIDWEDVDNEQRPMFDLVYDTPIYTHTPLPVIIMVPAVKGLNLIADTGLIPHIEDEPGLLGRSEEEVAGSRAEVITIILRMFTILLSGASIWLVYKTMRHKVGVNVWVFALPLAFGLVLISGSAYLFYWDVFMMFFFILTLYIMEVHPKSKWKYVTACALVNTKMFLGIAFLAPLVVKAIKKDWRTSWKMMLPALSILPFYIATVVVTGDPFYIITHYTAQAPIHNLMYTYFSPLDYLVMMFGQGVIQVLIMTAPILWYWKKYPEYALFWLMAPAYAWGTGLGRTHASTFIYVGIMIFPLVMYELRVIERIQNWVRARKGKNV